MTKDEAVAVLWEYHRLHQNLKPADLLLVLGSNDERVGVYAAGLYRQGLAPRVLFSGGAGRFTEGLRGTEAERFAAAAEAAGLPREAILLEIRSTNTGENIRFSREVLEENGLQPQSIIALQKPYMERRTLATLETQWPGMPFQVSAPQMTFDEYLTDTLNEEIVISAMVGDYQRILEYPRLGFSTEQPFSARAEEAFLTLVGLGYTSQLLR